MARGTTLSELLRRLRIACRVSVNPAHNAAQRDAQVAQLQAAQELFWGDYAWPHLRVDRFIPLQAGERYYDMPADLDIDRITKAQIRTNSQYLPLTWGIDAGQYAVTDSEIGTRSWPVQNVKITENLMLEVWPIPDQNFDPVTLEGQIKLTGIRKLKPLVESTDTADLDDELLILYVAAEYLAGTGAKDAQVKQDKANRHYLKLRGRLMPRKVFGNMFGAGDTPARKPVITNYRPAGS